MRNRNRIAALVACLAAAMLAVAWTLPAQDPLKVAPKNTRLLLENDRVRVFEFWAKPGEKEALHSHPAHVVYVVKGTKARFTTPDGKSQDVEMKAGQSIWGDPTTHTVEILGPGDAHVIVVELKGAAAPAKQPAKKKMM